MSYSETDPEAAAVAHVLRRATMAPHPDRLDSLSGLEDAVSFVLDAEPMLKPPPDLELEELTIWWMKQMIRPDAGIHERMTWFWHTVLVTNGDAGFQRHHVTDQLQLLRRNALGNFRQMLHEFTTDALLLLYLNAAGSVAFNPNENLARELMELFTMGRENNGVANYTQDDVAAAARALAGWSVDSAEDEPEGDEELPTTVNFNRDFAFVAPLVFLGEQKKWDRELIVDRLCDDPSTAKRISSILWTDLVGTELTNDQATELGAWWQENDLEIRPLVERILGSEGFGTARLNRPRSGLEWLLAAHTSIGFKEFDIWSMDPLEQIPFDPPNVSGWPRDDRWLSVGAITARTQYSWNLVSQLYDNEKLKTATTEEIVNRLGLQTLSDNTRATLDSMESRLGDMDPSARTALRWRIALCTPEFDLA